MSTSPSPLTRTLSPKQTRIGWQHVGSLYDTGWVIAPNGLPVAPQYVSFNVSSGGANTIVAPVPGKTILVLLYDEVASNIVAITWESSGGTILDGPYTVAQYGGKVPQFCPVGHFQTLLGEGLTLFLGSGVQVGGHVVYITY